MTPTTEQLKDLLAKVTPGEWVVDGFEITSTYLHPMDCITGVVTRADDATLIALAPTLAAEVVRLREALADMLFEYGGLYDKDCLVKDNHVLAMIDRARQALGATNEK